MKTLLSLRTRVILPALSLAPPLLLLAGIHNGVHKPWDLLLGCSAAAVIFGVQWVILRNATQPIKRIAALAATLPWEEPDGGEGQQTDLETLARTFDARIETLATTRTELEQRVRERTVALQQANDELLRRNHELGERSEELNRHRYREQSKGRALAALTADAELDAVIGAALGEIAGPVRAVVLICYRIDGTQLVPLAGYAASEAARTTVVPLAGIAEHVVRTRNPQVITDLPPDLDLRFDCLLAAGRPTALALIPLCVGNRPAGLLAAGSVGPFAESAVAMLSELASPLALTIARRTLVDHTERIARELAHRNQELADQAAALEAQGEELKTQKEELSVKNREVQKADRLKSEFLANMSHELRTPLNAVIGFSELLLDENEQLAPSHRQWVTDIHASGRHLLTLINRVLDLAKIESGHMTLSSEALPAAEPVAAAANLVGPAAMKKEITIEIVEAPQAAVVLADRGRLQQVLLNLLSNAVKFSRRKSRVEVGFELQDSAVRFWVKDTGPGIDAETQERLFEPFFQAESPLVKNHEGTGLGLAISRRLVEQQGGTLWVESVIDRGSTFFFTLPVATPDGAPAPAPREHALRFGLPSPCVLVVDDHDLNRELASALLTRRGCRVLLASGGEEAIAIARERLPDLVLLDLAMPRKDGFAVAAELKADPKTASIPVIALTAVVMRPGDERLQAAGFDGFLAKPLDRAALDSVLGRAFNAAASAAGGA